MKTNTLLKGFCASAVLTLAGCVAPDDQAASQETVVAEPVAEVADSTELPSPVVQTYFTGGSGNWGPSRGVLYRLIAIEHNGELLICGAYAAKGTGDLRRLGREVLRQARAEIRGQFVMRDLSFFKVTSSANWDEALVGVETNCKSTGLSASEVPPGPVHVITREGRYRVRG